MDNNFEQQFIKDVASNPAVNEPVVTTKTDSNKDGLGLFKVLAVIAVTLNIVVIIMIGILMNSVTNLASNSDSSTEEIEYENSEEDDDFSSNYVFDDDGNLTAMAATCTNDDGVTLKFSKDNTYAESDTASSTVDSGTYSVLRSEIITIVDTKNDSRVLYYDGFMIADGETIYECE